MSNGVDTLLTQHFYETGDARLLYLFQGLEVCWRVPHRLLQRVDPRVEEFLAIEKEWLTGEWTLAKVLMSAIVPLTLSALCLAFWRRSLVWGLIIINVVAIGKLMWGVVFGGGTGWAMLLPALVGLAVCNVAVLFAAHRISARFSRRQTQRSTPDQRVAERGERSPEAEKP